jgi:hypothetical protein
VQVGGLTVESGGSLWILARVFPRFLYSLIETLF